MSNKSDDKKIGGVGGAKVATPVVGAKSVSEVAGIKPTSGIGAVSSTSAVGGKRRPTRTMSLTEREELFRLINEETDKMLGASNGISAAKRAIVKEAVKMAVDSGLLDEGGAGKKK